MLPALRLVQEMLGYLPPAALRQVARKLEVTPEKDGRGRDLLQHAPAATRRGATARRLHQRLVLAAAAPSNILAAPGEASSASALGETSADGKFTLREVECLASCGTAPGLQINEDFHERLTPQKLDAVLDALT